MRDAFPAVHITHSETQRCLQPFDHSMVNETDECSHKDINSLHILPATLVINEPLLLQTDKLNILLQISTSSIVLAAVLDRPQEKGNSTESKTIIKSTDRQF